MIDRSIVRRLLLGRCDGPCARRRRRCGADRRRRADAGDRADLRRHGRRARCLRPLGAPSLSMARSGRRTACRAAGGLTNTATGSIPTTGAGTGSPTTPRTTGAGWSITTAAGFMTEGHGSGCRATIGRRPGSTGATAATISAGRRCRRTTWSTPTTIEPDYWAFVPLRYIGEPELRRHYVPRDRRMVLLRETRIINRPVHIEGRRLWVNPGLAPGFIAGAHACGAACLQRAPARVRRHHRRAGRGHRRAATSCAPRATIRRVAPVTIQRTTTAIAPTADVPPPKPLGKGEHGQLGSHPPRAAQGTVTPQPRRGSGGPPPKGPATIQKPTAQAPAVTPTHAA